MHMDLKFNQKDESEGSFLHTTVLKIQNAVKLLT